MEATASTTNIWAVLLPVIIGGLLALIGGLLGPIISHWLTFTTARRAQRLAQFEALLSTIYEHEHWLDMNLKSAMGEATDYTSAPLHRAQTLIILYFPSLLEPLLKLDVASKYYIQWVAEFKNRRFQGDISQSVDSFNDIYKQYIDEQTKFINDAAAYAKEKLN